MRLHWFPGYSVAAVSTVALICTAPAQTMLLSLLNLPLREAFQIDPLVLNTSYTIATMTASLPLVWVGKTTDRLGPKKTLMIVALAFGLACLFMAGVAHVVMVFVAFFLLRFLGQGSLAVVSGHALAMWFHARLGTIAGIRQVILFGLWTPLPGITLALIEGYGWRFTWALFGVLIPTTLISLAWLFMKDRPEDVGLGLDGRVGSVQEEGGHTLHEALRTPAYWILAAAGMLPPMIGTALLFDIQPLLRARGVPLGAAASAASVWSATMALMAIPSGRLVDRFAPRWLLVTGLAVLGVSCLLWLGVSTTSSAVVAMSACAVGQSLIASTESATTARFFGRRHHGAIRSSLARMNILATGLGPLVFGLSHRFASDYRPALLVFVAVCVPAAFAAAWLTPPPLDKPR